MGQMSDVAFSQGHIGEGDRRTVGLNGQIAYKRGELTVIFRLLGQAVAILSICSRHGED